MELLQTQVGSVSNYVLPIILFLAAQTIAFITVCVTVYVKTMAKLKELEVRVQIFEKNEVKIFDKLDEVLKAVHCVDVKLEKKQDK